MIALVELQKFVQLANIARKNYMGSDGATSREWYEERGVSPELIDWLIKHNYASQKKGKSLWVAFTNKFHPEKTIGTLVRAMEMAKKEEEK